MHDIVNGPRTIDELRQYIHQTLCQKENLVADQFEINEMQLKRRGRVCGLQFALHGPRMVRLGAIWASDQNIIYFYDASGERFRKVRLKARLTPSAMVA